MAPHAAAVQRDIEAFCDRLLERGIRPERVILFGSTADGRRRTDSDIDLIVVSKDFHGKGFRRRLELLGMTAGDALVPIQAIGYTPREFAAPGSTSFLAAVLAQRTVEVSVPRAKRHKTRKPRGTDR